MTSQEINQLAQEVHEAQIQWWQDINTGEPIERNPDELLMLVITEVAEAMEGERKNLMDDKLPHRKMAEVEMADAYIRLLDYAAGFDIKIAIPKMSFEISDNKGEALFDLCETIAGVRGDYFFDLGAAFIHIENYCSKFGYDLFGAIKEKRAYNATREDHKHEARRAANGKKF